MTARVVGRRRRRRPQPPDDAARLRALLAPRGRRLGWRRAAVLLLHL